MNGNTRTGAQGRRAKSPGRQGEGDGREGRRPRPRQTCVRIEGAGHDGTGGNARLSGGQIREACQAR
jgi:hypothetical protein